MEAFDKQLAEEDRKALLYADNFAGHRTTLNLQNIELKFLPANSTSLSQPLDQGIIKVLKFHYRKLLLDDRILKMDSGKTGKSLEIDLLDAVRMLVQAWEKVTSQTIRNCFRHARFLNDVNVLIVYKY